MIQPTPASRRAGRAVGRWWRRNGPGIERATRPARRSWASAVGAMWFMGYGWIGLLLAAAAARLSTGPAIASTVVAMGGAVLIGGWLSRHRMRRHVHPGTPPPERLGLALLAWVALTGLAVLLQR